jgi:hypothetical protein
MKDNAVTVLLVVTSAVLPYLLSQNDVTIPPVLKVVLTAANIAVVAIARLSNPNSSPQQVTVTGPVQVTPDAPEVPHP